MQGRGRRVADSRLTKVVAMLAIWFCTSIFQFCNSGHTKSDRRPGGDDGDGGGGGGGGGGGVRVFVCERKRWGEGDEWQMMWVHVNVPACVFAHT